MIGDKQLPTEPLCKCLRILRPAKAEHHEFATDPAHMDNVHAWKSFTAKEANRHLGRTGAFGAPDYFDRYM